MVALLTELTPAPADVHVLTEDECDREAAVSIDGDDVERLASLVEADGGLLDRLRTADPPALVRAAQSSSPRVAAFLLDQGFDIEQTDKIHRSSPLSWCAFSGSYPVAALLVERGANVNHRNAYDNTPLVWALRGEAGESQRWGAPIDRSLFRPIAVLLRKAGGEE